jgi:6-phosphogluconolactonase (cycloisomerase 2 family)
LKEVNAMHTNIKLAVSAILVILAAGEMGFAQDQQASRSQLAYLTTARPLTILSANDGEVHYLHTATGMEQQYVEDSFTVIHLGPDHPPVTKTVFGTVPVTIHGSPHLAITADGRYGFIANHGWRDERIVSGNDKPIPPEHLKNVLTVIDLAADEPDVVDQQPLPAEAWMLDAHPDGRKVIVAVGAGFHIYALQDRKLELVAAATAPATVFSFDVSPRGDRIIAVTADTHESISNAQVHLFGLQGDAITYLHRVEAAEGMGVIEQGFSPRISPDGRSALVLHDFGVGGKGTLDDVLLVDLTLAKPEVTQRLPQVGDGLESLAFHPSGRFAVICCLNKGANITTTSHLATVDLTSRPLRVLNYLPIDPVPEGIEFTADGKQLFVQAALANHIVVFDVDADAMLLQRSPFVLHTGHAPSAMSISPRFQQ